MKKLIFSLVILFSFVASANAQSADFENVTHLAGFSSFQVYCAVVLFLTLSVALITISIFIKNKYASIILVGISLVAAFILLAITILPIAVISFSLCAGINVSIIVIWFSKKTLKIIGLILYYSLVICFLLSVFYF